MQLTGQIPNWWVWGYWVSPLTYGFNAISVNEMFAPRWMDKFVSSFFLFILRNRTESWNQINEITYKTTKSEYVPALGLRQHDKTWGGSSQEL